ncbi:MAG TPA: D-xylose ABC transporter ATP-binding protein [Lentisphaeria bacterium]|nr:MAG: D-xylose ABC transporter ATP-binding protein [Lentisphaerae bacterium GWF2_50_93]HCE42434.1 D-xylose ABC transporter ATP-binding protein [Lentisphaeria bacterium]
MSSSHKIILQVDRLTKTFPGVRALNQVSFDLREGEVHSLCGENGAGKSTLIKCLSGIWTHGSYDGTIKIDGKEAVFNGVSDSEHAGIAVIYQELALVKEMTIAENIFLGNEPTVAGIIDWNIVFSETRKLLDRYGLKLDPASVVGDLGVGQQQLVEIVKALSKNRKILLLDEPTAALTETEVEILLNIIWDLRKKGITCVYISHKLDEVFAISDRITILRDGESVTTLEASASNKHEVIKHMVGREITQLFPRRPTTPGKPLLEVTNLNVYDDQNDKKILHDISFEVKAGEVLGFGGLMGAGRTELIMHIFGAYGRRMNGNVMLNGKSLDATTPAKSIASGLMLVSEDRKRYGLILDQSIGFNQSLASLGSFLTLGMFIDGNREVKKNWEFFKSLRVKAPGLDSVVGGLSGGNQQKVVIAKALMTGPSVIFLDEPTRGIDVGAKQEVYELMNLLTDSGKAVVLVSSEMPELMGMSDRMIILSEGHIGGEFKRGEAEQHNMLEAAMKFHGKGNA